MKPSVLITTAWWPSKTKWFPLWAHGISEQLDDPAADTELFITTTTGVGKFKSIVGSMAQAYEWAKEKKCTHIFNVEADKEIYKGALGHLLAHNLPVILMGRGSGKDLVSYSLRDLDEGMGWGSILVKMEILEQVPFGGSFFGDFYSPDRAWFKQLLQLGIPVYVDYNCPVKTLEPHTGDRR